MRKAIFWLHFVTALILLAFSVTWMIQDIYSIGKSSNSNFIMFSCPATLVLPLALLSWVYLRQKPRTFLQLTPLIISGVAILVAIVLFSYENSNPDFAFYRNRSIYDSFVNSVHNNEFEVDQTGEAILPDEVRLIVPTGLVYVTLDADQENIYIEEGSDNFDLISWGYVHTSDGKAPGDGCAYWRELIPPTPNWYYCDGHRWVDFTK